MPELHLYLAFVAAVTVLMLIPGPNVALIVANSVTYGFRYGLLTVAGTSSAMLVQLALTALGMTELLGQLGAWFDWIRWIGVAYLVYLGVTQWRAPPLKLTDVRAEPKSAQAMYTRALLVSLTNPKTLFFYGAFFPQFVVMTHDVGLQVGDSLGHIRVHCRGGRWWLGNPGEPGAALPCHAWQAAQPDFRRHPDRGRHRPCLRKAELAQPLLQRGEHGSEHRRRQPSGIGVVARAVIAVGQQQPGLHAVNGAVPEGMERQALAQRSQYRSMGDAAQRQDGFQLRQARDLIHQERAAGGDFRRRRLVLRRHAAHRIGDAAIDQPSPSSGSRPYSPRAQPKSFNVA